MPYMKREWAPGPPLSSVKTHPASPVGVSGGFYASGGAEGIVTPDDFSLVPPGGTVSFCKKEMVGPTVPRLEGGSPRLRPVAAFLVPAPWAGSLRFARNK